MVESPMLIKALDIAHQVHNKQTRSDGIEPYINHPVRVSSLIEKLFPHYASEVTLSAAILHDTLEDCSKTNVVSVYKRIYEESNETVAAYVDMLTKSRNQKFVLPHQKELLQKRYFAKLMIAPNQVIIIKLADRIDNLQTISKTNWDIKKTLYYINQSIKLQQLAANRMLVPESQHLLTEIMLCQSYINTLAIK